MSVATVYSYSPIPNYVQVKESREKVYQTIHFLILFHSVSCSQYNLLDPSRFHHMMAKSNIHILSLVIKMKTFSQKHVLSNSFTYY